MNIHRHDSRNVSGLKSLLPVCPVRTILALLLGWALAVPGTLSVLAAGPSGSIRGAIVDSTGGVIPGVTVVLTRAGTGTTRSVITDDNGYYCFNGLLPGNYELKAELEGFNPITVTGITLQAGQTLDLGGGGVGPAPVRPVAPPPQPAPAPPPVTVFDPRSVAEKGADENRTLSPYFVVNGADPETDRLPLKSTAVKVRIAGVIADVRVTQTYTNEGENPLEAIYVFPCSTRAAVYGMKMTVGGRVIEARIREKNQARVEYERAKQEGRSASLLVQERPNVFTMNVANILPGDLIAIELRYTELLVPTDGIYEFVYPTVVMPRYSNQPAGTARDNDSFVESPYTAEGELPESAFDITVSVAAGLPIPTIACLSHAVTVEQPDPSRAVVRLDESEAHGGNRDYILKYCLSGYEIQSGLLAYEGEDDGENFFLLMVEPPKTVTEEQVLPREYIFIVDVSGSMSGYPLDISKKLLHDLVGGLRPTDRFNVILFAGGSRVLAESSLPASPGTVQQALYAIDHEQGGGGTELLPAMKRALALPRLPGFSRSIVIATDGGVAVEKETFDLVREHLGEANLFAFGIGTSVNRFLIEGLARAGQGEPFIVINPDEAPREAARFRDYVLSPLLSSIHVEYQGLRVHDVEPPAVGDLLADRPLIIYGKWDPPFAGIVTVSGNSPDGTYIRDFDLSEIQPDPAHVALRQLWARERIADLGDYTQLGRDDARVKEITDLGLRYNLMTDYTSFLAVDRMARNPGGQQFPVAQPLPLPEGVSAKAFGGLGMQPSALACEVEVRAEAPLVDTTTTTVGAIASESHIGSLPLRRNSLALIALSPEGGNAEAGPSISGGQPGENRYRLDGVDAIGPGGGGADGNPAGRAPAGAGSGQNIQAVAEARISSAGLDASVGRTTGGVVNVITKSGTNEFHGSASFYAQPAGFQAARQAAGDTRLTPVTQTTSREDLGPAADLGGYLAKDRLFFYLNAAPRRESASQTAPPGFGQALAGINPYVRRERSLTGLGKLTWVVSPNHTLDVSTYADSAGTDPGPNRTMLSPGTEAWSSPNAGSWTARAGYTWVAGPTLCLDASLARTWDRSREGLLHPEAAAFLDYVSFYQNEIPEINPAAPAGNYGSCQSGGAGYTQNGTGTGWQADVCLAWTWRSHNLNFGTDNEWSSARLVRGYSGGAVSIPGWGDFPGAVTAGALVRRGWLTDAAGRARDLDGDGAVDAMDALYIQTGGYFTRPDIQSRTGGYAFFARDDWKITPRLLLNLGLRCEFQSMSGLSGSASFPWNWAPRVGLNWDVRGDCTTGVKVFWGRYSQRLPASLAGRAFSGEGFVSGALWGDPGLTDFRNDDLGEPIRYFGGRPADRVPRTKAPYQDEFMVSFQQEIQAGLALRASFVRRDLKRALACVGTMSAETYLQSGRQSAYRYLLANPSSSLDAVNNATGAPGADGLADGWPAVRRSFTALELGFERRFSAGWQFTAGYRLAFLTGNYDGPDTGAGPGGGAPAGGPFDFLPGPSLGALFQDGPLALDQRHIFTFFGCHEFGFGLVAGWGVRCASGVPLTPLGTHPVYQMDGSIPLAPRGSAGRGDWEIVPSLHVEYRLPLGGERCRLALGADLFNILNRQSVALTDTSARSFFGPNPDYGRPLGYTEPFRIRLLARVEF